MHTIVELFDECQLENVIAALKLHPQKIIFIGFCEDEATDRIDTIREFFRLRSTQIAIEYVAVDRYAYEDVMATLEKIIRTEPDAAFDLTGGKELVLVAMGAVSQQYAVPMFQVDIRCNRIRKIAHCEQLPAANVATLTVRESFALNGGKISFSNFNRPIEAAFAEEIQNVWRVACRDFGAWNEYAKELATLEKHCSADVDTHGDTQVRLVIDHVRPNYDFINRLYLGGLITSYRRVGNTLQYTYKSKAVRDCIAKAGNILEWYTMLAAQEITARQAGYFDGIECGVKVDWNYDEAQRRSDIKTINEIDVVMMRDTIPVFVSCKGGKADKEALYELQTVADRLGGEHAVRIMVTTNISKNEKTRKQFLKRAEDMGITVIADVDDMSLDEFKDALIQATEFLP